MNDNKPTRTDDPEFPWRLGGVELSADGKQARVTYRVVGEFSYTVDVARLGLDVGALYAGAFDAAAEGHPLFTVDDDELPEPVTDGVDSRVLVAVLHGELVDGDTLAAGVGAITDLAEADNTTYALADDTDPHYISPGLPDPDPDPFIDSAEDPLREL